MSAANTWLKGYLQGSQEKYATTAVERARCADPIHYEQLDLHLGEQTWFSGRPSLLFVYLSVILPGLGEAPIVHSAQECAMDISPTTRGGSIYTSSNDKSTLSACQ